MVNVRAWVCLMAVSWVGTSQAAMVFLADELASEIVAQDSTGINKVSVLAANDAGIVWGAPFSSTALRRIENGAYTEYTYPSEGIRAITRYDQNTSLAGGSAAGTPSLYKIDASGNVTQWVTLPVGVSNVESLAASPVDGSVLVSTLGGGERLIKYDSTGALLWNVVKPLGNLAPVAYSASGQGYATATDGRIYSVDSTDGTMTLMPFGVSTEYAGDTLANIQAIAFIDDDYFLASTFGGNEARVVRTQLSTGDTDLLVHWDFEIPAIERYLSYTANGLYLNSFDPATQQGDLESDFMSFGLLALDSSETYGIQLLQGDFLGDFSGLNALGSGVPEPGSLWLLLGLLAPWMKRDAVRNRHTVRAQRGR